MMFMTGFEYENAVLSIFDDAWSNADILILQSLRLFVFQSIL